MTSIDLAINSSLHVADDTSDSTNATLSIRIFGGTTYALLSFLGIVLNILLGLVLIKDKSFIKKSAFYLIVWQLIICDLLTHFMQFVIAVPITFTGCPVNLAYIM
jgi:hypothetical protein